MQQGTTSYLAWARVLTAQSGQTVSKQAVFSRMNEAWVSTVQMLLREVVGQQAKQQRPSPLLATFGHVWLQDSTTLHLPDVLVKKFKGNVSRGQQRAVAKLNVIVHAISGLCPVMEWSSFTVNEQKLSDSILRVARAGDLVIRDLGYFVLPVFAQLIEARIFFLSRWKYNASVSDPSTGQPLALAKLLQGKKVLDQEVYCGKKTPIKVRLVALALSPQQANERIRKARQNRDRRLHHTKDYYQLLSYVIFLTNVPATVWHTRQVADAYRVRWSIETLFKSWKSGFCIERLIPDAQVHTARVESVLYLLLLYIAWFQLRLLAPLRWAVYKQTGKHLSVLKLAALVNAYGQGWLMLQKPKHLLQLVAYHCCYEKRRNRTNDSELLLKLFLPLT